MKTLIAIAAIMLCLMGCSEGSGGIGSRPVGKLGLTVEKIEQESGGARIYARISNDTPYLCERIFVDVPFYDRNGQLLGSGVVNVNNVRPGSSALDDTLLINVAAADISSWKPNISNGKFLTNAGKEVWDTDMDLELLWSPL